MRDSEIVFRDLAYEYQELINNQNNPFQIRRIFGRFIVASQQLTSTFRKEYKAIKNDDWQAKEFTGWNAVTGLFKVLRNYDQHECPVTINVKETQFYPVGEIEAENGKSRTIYMAPEVVWGLGDPFSEEIPHGEMEIEFFDENKNKINGMELKKIEYSFILNAKTEEIKQLIKNSGSDDIHILSKECYEVLKQYYEFYKQKIK